ncbi:MAG: phage terminase large subunit [Clostridia bacterium]|nr:phage terminase large subunit [Clostridia bacterium]MBQ8637450.1 phage terminase large subunit [Clostridia bacterium]
MQNNIDLSRCSDKQLRFLASKKRFVGYGGARGGGKSWALRKKITLLGMNYAGIRILLLRRTYPELKENHINTLLVELKGIATYKESDKVFTFHNGSKIKLGYCDSESDVLQYQGLEYDIICMDEATQFTEYQFQTLTACLRGANDFPKRMYLTCNPGGVGHEWVKRLFITKRYKQDENPEDYEFIPATVFDNQILMEKDPEYLKMLNNLDEKLRQAWRDGNWDMLAGQYFTEFDRSVHIIEPIPIPEHWKKYRAIDYGLDCLACVWVAIDELGNYYVYREYGEPDKIISDGAKELVELSGNEYIQYTVAPSDLWARSQETAKCKADIFSENGLPLIKGNNNRETGWLAIKDLLKVYETDEGVKESKIKIFSTCVQLIEYLPSLQRDNKKPTDCATEPHNITHLPDALRYFAVQYIYPSSAPKPEQTALDKYKNRLIKNQIKKRSYF